MYAALITGPSTAVSRWSSFFIRSKMLSQRQNVFLCNSRRLAAPRTWLHVLKPKRLSHPPPPHPHSSLLLRVSYSLSLICQPDIRGHEAPHHHHWTIHLCLTLLLLFKTKCVCVCVCVCVFVCARGVVACVSIVRAPVFVSGELFCFPCAFVLLLSHFVFSFFYQGSHWLDRPVHISVNFNWQYCTK